MPVKADRPSPGSSGPVVLFQPGFDATYFNDQGRPFFVSFRCGVVSQPGQNGHIYLDVNSNNPNSWLPVDYVACRNNQAVGTGGTAPVGGGTAQIGNGKALQAVVPAGWFYRFRTFTATGYAAPSFLSDGANPAYWVLL